MFGKVAFRMLPAVRKLQAVALLLPLLLSAFAGHAQDTKRGRKYKAPPPTAKVEVTVLRATNGKPIENASVIFHPLEEGKNAGNMELKTDDEGKTVIDLLNIGSQVRLQIIAQGFQTYGEDFKVDKEKMTLEIKLRRPTEQYSIYQKNEGKPTAKPDGSPDGPDRKTDGKSDGDKPAPNDDQKPRDPPQPK